MNATLTYLGRDQGLPIRTFELDAPETVVGRGPREVLELPEVAEKVSNREPFQARLGDTLFIGIPGHQCLARSHFAIRRAADECGRPVFLIRDLGSHGGFMVNDVRNRGRAEMQLQDGDRIHYGFGFVFNLGS